MDALLGEGGPLPRGQDSWPVAGGLIVLGTPAPVQRVAQNSWLSGPPTPQSTGRRKERRRRKRFGPCVLFCFFAVSPVPLLAHCT